MMRFLPLIPALLAQVHGDDSSSLMQSDVVSADRAKAAAMSNIVTELTDLPLSHTDRKFAVSVMMGQVKKVEKLDANAIDLLGQVKDLLKQITDEMTADRDEDQAELDAVKNMITQCHQLGTALESTAYGNVTTAKSAYDTCKTGEAEKFSDEATKCGALIADLTYLKGNQLKCVFPTDTGYDGIAAWNTFFSEGLMWFEDANDRFTETAQPCKDAIDALKDKQDECKEKQTTYESDYCQWEIARYWMCNHQSTCYSNAETYYNNVSAFVVPAAVVRKDEGQAIARIECLIDNLLANPQSFDLTACENQKTAAELQSAYGVVEVDPLPALQECNHISPIPGDVAWANHYQPEVVGAPSVPNLVNCSDL